MFTRMKINKKKGLTLTGNLAESQVGTAKLEGQTLLETHFQGPTLKRATTRVAPTILTHPRGGRMDSSGVKLVFSPSPKLSPGLSNQPKTFIYLFWQSQCQIANLSPIL